LIRASVWIEQEIAIAAYMKQVRRKDIGIRLFLQKGIVLEGIREKLIINPFEFESNDEVVTQLESFLPTWRDSLRPREPETLQERLVQYQHSGQTVTVRGDLPNNRLIGNQRWAGSNQCKVTAVTEGYVTFLKLEGNSVQTVSLKYVAPGSDDEIRATDVPN